MVAPFERVRVDIHDPRTLGCIRQACNTPDGSHFAHWQTAFLRPKLVLAIVLRFETIGGIHLREYRAHARQDKRTRLA